MADQKVDYKNPIYSPPARSEYDEPRFHQSIGAYAGASTFVGAGTYAIGERNHIPCGAQSRSSSGATENNLNSSLRPFFG